MLIIEIILAKLPGIVQLWSEGQYQVSPARVFGFCGPRERELSAFYDESIRPVLESERVFLLTAKDITSTIR